MVIQRTVEGPCEGRYWLLKTARNRDNTTHTVAQEKSDLVMAQELLRNDAQYAAVFDVVTSRLWKPQGTSPEIVLQGGK